MNIRKSKVFAVAAAACVLGMMLGGAVGLPRLGTRLKDRMSLRHLTPNRRMA